MDNVAVRVWRGDLVESVHRAHVAVVDVDGTTGGKFGDAKHVAYLRSAAKPFQALPVITTGAAEAFGFTDAEIAVVAGSHSGESHHVKVVEGILEKIGLGPEHLRCGRHPPFHKETAASLGEDYGVLHHNCSGKHAGMLAVCVHNGWPTEGYIDAEHDVQKLVTRAVADACELDVGDVKLAVDGCGVLAFAVPLRNAARAFARLASPASVAGDLGEALDRVRAAMRAHPEMVAGTGRLDTRVAQATHGRVLVKAGAEAFFGSAFLAARLGVAIKVEDGAMRAVGPILGAVFSAFGEPTETEIKALSDEFAPVLTNHAGRTVGRIEAEVEF